MQQYRRREYVAAAHRIQSTMPHLTPAPIRPYTTDAIQTVLREAKKPSVEVKMLDPQSRRASRVRVTVDDSNRNDRAVARVVADRAGATLARHAKQADREAITDTANAAGDRIGWARVLTGAENCPWCAMLASRGPVYTSQRAAMFRGGSAVDTYHDHCDCEAVLVRKGHDWAGRAEYERLDDLWATSTAGLGGKEAVKAFGRAYQAAQVADPNKSPQEG
jgi:hypothetical protein